MNEILIGSQAALESGNISAIVEELSRIPTLPPPETDTVTEGSTPLRMPTIKALENTRKQVRFFCVHLTSLGGRLSG